MANGKPNVAALKKLQKEFSKDKKRYGILVIRHRPTRFEPFERPLPKDTPFLDTCFVGDRDDNDVAVRNFRMLASETHFVRTGERRPDGWLMWLDYLVDRGFEGVRLAVVLNEAITAEEFERLKAAGHNLDQFCLQEASGRMMYVREIEMYDIGLNPAARAVHPEQRAIDAREISAEALRELVRQAETGFTDEAPGMPAARRAQLSVERAEADAQTTTFDLNKPTVPKYHHQEYPKMLYHHERRGTLIVQGKAEEDDALESGYVREPFLPPDTADEIAKVPVKFWLDLGKRGKNPFPPGHPRYARWERASLQAEMEISRVVAEWVSKLPSQGSPPAAFIACLAGSAAAVLDVKANCLEMIFAPTVDESRLYEKALDLYIDTELWNAQQRKLHLTYGEAALTEIRIALHQRKQFRKSEFLQLALKNADLDAYAIARDAVPAKANEHAINESRAAEPAEAVSTSGGGREHHHPESAAKSVKQGKGKGPQRYAKHAAWYSEVQRAVIDSAGNNATACELLDDRKQDLPPRCQAPPPRGWVVKNQDRPWSEALKQYPDRVRPWLAKVRDDLRN